MSEGVNECVCVCVCMCSGHTKYRQALEELRCSHRIPSSGGRICQWMTRVTRNSETSSSMQRLPAHRHHRGTGFGVAALCCCCLSVPLNFCVVQTRDTAMCGRTDTVDCLHRMWSAPTSHPRQNTQYAYQCKRVKRPDHVPWGAVCLLSNTCFVQTVVHYFLCICISHIARTREHFS